MEHGAFAEVGNLEYISEHARAVHANRNLVVFFPRPFDQCHVFHFIRGLAKYNGGERTEGGLNFHLFDALDEGLVLKPVFNQVGNGNQFQVEFVRQFPAFGQTRHRAVLVHDLHNDSGGFKTCKAGKINGSLRVACSAKDASLSRAQWKYVPWLA